MAAAEKPFHSSVYPAETLVLYVEDDLINQQVLQHSLMDKPHIIVRTSSTLEETRDVLDELECWPDLILMDNQLIGVTGGEVMQEIWKLYPGTKAIPLVMCTALSTSEAAKIAQQCEAQAFLCKPYNIKDLVSTIKLHALQGLPASRSTPEMLSQPSGVAELQPPPLPPHASAPMHVIAKVKSTAVEYGMPGNNNHTESRPAPRPMVPLTTLYSQESNVTKPTRTEALLGRHSASAPRSHHAILQSNLYTPSTQLKEGLLPASGASSAPWAERFGHHFASSKQSHVQNEIGGKPFPSGSLSHMTTVPSGDLSTQLSSKQDSVKSSTKNSYSGGGHGLGGNELSVSSSRTSLSTFGNQAALAEIIRVLERGPVGVRDSHHNVQLTIAELCDILEMHYIGRMLAEKGLDIAKLCTMSAWDIMQSGVVVLSQLEKLMNGLAALG